MMGDQAKKISFGFSKLAKKTAIVSTHTNKDKKDDEGSKVEFIDCLEGKSIKLKDPVKENEGPLVIPLTRKKEEKTISQLANPETFISKNFDNELQIKPPNESCKTTNSETDSKDEAIKNDIQNKNETLDEIAAREILQELNQKKSDEDAKRVFSVPLTSNAPSGEKESTLEDYDNVPVGEFGLAMLRGMGWAPGKGIGKTEKLVAPAIPTVRPKGMGLGADKVMKTVVKKNTNEELKMVKGSFIRVLAGSEKDAYGQIEGFDEESGRLIVKLALKNEPISLNEFMVQLVDSNEFSKNSKVINVSKYEQYKEEEGKKESRPTENRLQESTHGKTPDRKPTSYEKLFDRPESKTLKKNRSSSCESEENNMRNIKTKDSSELPGSRSDVYNRRSRSPNDRTKEVSKSRDFKYHSSKEDSLKNYKNQSRATSKKHRSYSSDSSSSSGSYNRPNSKVSESKSSKINISDKHRSDSRRRTSSKSSDSDSSGTYSRMKKNKHKKKHSSKKKYKSRSRSRSPRKHKLKRSRY